MVTDRRGSDATESDATLAVVAHGLLTSLSVIQGANLMLRDDWDRLTEQRRIELINMALLGEMVAPASGDIVNVGVAREQGQPPARALLIQHHEQVRGDLRP